MLPMVGRLELDDLWGPYHLKPFYDSITGFDESFVPRIKGFLYSLPLKQQN